MTERENDDDAFRIDLEAGTKYRIDIKGKATGRGTLPYWVTS